MHKSFHGGTEITQYLTKLLPKTEDYTWTTKFHMDVAQHIKVSSVLRIPKLVPPNNFLIRQSTVKWICERIPPNPLR